MQVQNHDAGSKCHCCLGKSYKAVSSCNLKFLLAPHIFYKDYFIPFKILSDAFSEIFSEHIFWNIFY